jgi:hypothetical protein
MAQDAENLIVFTLTPTLSLEGEGAALPDTDARFLEKR